jgi:hypothetical protein
MGVAVAGMFTGLLLGVLLTDPLTRLTGPAPALSLLLPVLAALGAATGALIAWHTR